MCGIIGYIGEKPATPILLQGLRRLEYRGYDSAGVAIQEGAELKRIRALGKIENLAKQVKTVAFSGVTGIAHTRWATHGSVTQKNAHPHTGFREKIVIVHNGIIENYREIKGRLGDEHVYESETDSEVLAHLIEHCFDQNTSTTSADRLRHSVEQALKQVRGTYGILVMHKDIPGCIVAARMGSPLVVGIGDNEHYIASDATPLLVHTKKVIYLADGEIAQITKDTIHTFTLQDDMIEKSIEELAWSDQQAQRLGFDHFLIKEIHDQPTVLKDAIRGRYNLEDGVAHLGGINMTIAEMQSVRRIVLIACGTASYAGMVGKYAFERLAGIPTEVDVASEFRYRDPVVDRHTLVFAISQSGETADTLAALREAKRKGAFVRGIVNVVGSTIARETDGGTYIHAGPEISVASTKVFTNMVAILTLYALQFGRLKRVTPATGKRLLAAMLEIPEKIQYILDQKDSINTVAQKYCDYDHMFFLGRGVNYPVALEGALKCKELSYIHCEGYPGGELKHGPFALLCEDVPVFAILTKNQLYDKMRSNIEEVRARGSRIILIATEGDMQAKELADEIIYVPQTMELLEPLLNTIPLQLFSYYVSLALKRDVDRPRNLAKSVTVE